MLQAVAAPVSTRLWPEEVRAHIIVDTNDVKALVGEKANRLGPNQPGRSGNEGYHLISPLTSRMNELEFTP
jgi:hypothetical protein